MRDCFGFQRSPNRTEDIPVRGNLKRVIGGKSCGFAPHVPLSARHHAPLESVERRNTLIFVNKVIISASLKGESILCGNIGPTSLHGNRH